MKQDWRDPLNTGLESQSSNEARGVNKDKCERFLALDQAHLDEALGYLSLFQKVKKRMIWNESCGSARIWDLEKVQVASNNCHESNQVLRGHQLE
jgi:hypothetical protein